MALEKEVMNLGECFNWCCDRTMRYISWKEEYFSAITQGFGVIGHIEKQKHWRQFVDRFGWWFVVVLAFWPRNIRVFHLIDKRAEGIKPCKWEQNLYFYCPAKYALYLAGRKKNEKSWINSDTFAKTISQKCYQFTTEIGRIYMYENKFARSEQTLKRWFWSIQKSSSTLLFRSFYLRCIKNDLAYKHLNRYLQYSLSDS